MAIDVVDATKVIDGITVLDHVSFSAQPGRVTAFLGPNGAGKSTMLRAILGVAHLTSGRVTIGGRALAEHASPLRVAGAHLTPDAVHPRRTARGHLSVLAATNGLPSSSVADVIELVGLGDIADLQAGQMSLGMRQRLGLAAALIGDPAAVILDEPHNGLDVGAIRWLRVVLRTLADAGRTVLVCSHLMGEVEQVADDVVVLDQGRVVAEGTLVELLAPPAGRRKRPSLEDRYLELVPQP
ncbi:MAG: ATP-binding cassette domain-containing protein [Actinomycetota bacterium]|nr:ATP-binding cassette domain-containing protein [Actinomycetota bacterium]